MMFTAALTGQVWMIHPMLNGSVGSTSARQQVGMALLGMLLMLVIIGITSGATAQVWHTVQQREKERELLYIGHQFREAIRMYYQQTAGQEKKYPPSLAALTKDERVPGMRRYLRKLYRDPLTGSDEWGLVYSPTGGIIGVYSLAQGAPLKKANFAPEDSAFVMASSYSDWVFKFIGDSRPTLNVSTPPASSIFKPVSN